MIERQRHSLDQIGQIRFLIFEPEQVLRSLLRGILLSMGAREITAVGSFERMRDIRRDVIDMVILRLTPDSLGEGLVRSVRKGTIAIRSHVPVIAYASQPTVDMIRAALHAGADEIIALPFTGRSVMGKVTAVLVNPKPLVQVNGYFGPDHTEALGAIDSFLVNLR